MPGIEASFSELSSGHHQGDHVPVWQLRKRVFSSHFYSECCYLGHLGVADTLNGLLSRRTPWDEPLYGVICYSTAGDIQAAFPKCSVPHQAGLFSKAAFPLRWRQRRGGDTDQRCKKTWHCHQICGSSSRWTGSADPKMSFWTKSAKQCIYTSGKEKLAPVFQC